MDKVKQFLLTTLFTTETRKGRKLKRGRVIVAFAVLVLLFTVPFALLVLSSPEHKNWDEQQPYAIESSVTKGTTKFRFMHKGHCFVTLRYDRGKVTIIPYPRLDENSRGPVWHAQPFLPGAALKYSRPHNVHCLEDGTGIRFTTLGHVSQGDPQSVQSFGSWSMSMILAYSPEEKRDSTSPGFLASSPVTSRLKHHTICP